MELVHGIGISRFCDENRLQTAERLNLFIPICHAIQHAHQKGIIHRDIKPSNVLVAQLDSGPVPKVIDFGIAKALHQPLTDATLVTSVGQFIGTPAYVSPEQAEMSLAEVDTRSDIYALGVLLYELLTGHTPFAPRELLQTGFDEMRRLIREQEPPRPSARLSFLPASEVAAIARQRRTDPSTLVRSLRGDLDWIVMKCLEKNPARLSEELQDQPIARADLRLAIGFIYQDLKEYARAEAAFHEARAAYVARLGQEHPGTRTPTPRPGERRGSGTLAAGSHLDIRQLTRIECRMSRCDPKGSPVGR